MAPSQAACYSEFAKIRANVLTARLTSPKFEPAPTSAFTKTSLERDLHRHAGPASAAARGAENPRRLPGSCHSPASGRVFGHSRESRRRADGPRGPHRRARGAADAARCARACCRRSGRRCSPTSRSGCASGRSTMRSPARAEAKAEFSTVSMTPGQLTLVETSTMDESVIRGNLKRVVENLCYDELQQLNRGVGFLLDRPDLETDGNPLAPATIVDCVRGCAEGRPGRDADQVPGAEGAEPDVAVRDQRDLRRPEQAPRGTEDRAGGGAAGQHRRRRGDRTRRDGKRPRGRRRRRRRHRSPKST